MRMSICQMRLGWYLAISVIAALLAGGSPSQAEVDEPWPESAEIRSGLIDVVVDDDTARVWLRFDAEAPEERLLRCIYTPGLRGGLGSNPVGLDRGLMRDAMLVRFVRVGDRILLLHENTRFRALSDRPAERRAVDESFARSVLWSGRRIDVEEGGHAVELTSLLTSDQLGIAARLRDVEEGSFSLDTDASVVLPDEALVFPRNLEFDALLTLESTDPGSEIWQTAPSAERITLTAHHSFVALPDDGYQPRAFHPRIAGYPLTFLNYSSAISEPIERKLLVRWRLQKVNPGAAPSRVVKPIVFYVDPGAPEPIRSALVDGARWWAAAFESAGFIDAYRVEILPEDAHPLDARYNVIQWVHRATRGWSYGGGVIDPRTGEIIKGHVTLGSLRVRQDRLLFEGLLGAGATGSGAPEDPVQLSLARLRQLSAHEVGHTLGIAHNFAASTYDDRASVMDYPAPRIRLRDDGGFDVSGAYGVGVGTWDHHTIRYMYSEFAPGEEAEGLASIVRDGIENGMLFLSDQDARSVGAGHPLASLWDNGADPIASLRDAMALRAEAMNRFGLSNIDIGRPVAQIQETFAPVYFHHRFQVNAAAKFIGGHFYDYAVTGEPTPQMTPVSPDRQREALAALLSCVTPEALETPAAVEMMLAPRPFGSARNREMFPSRIGTMFDPLAASEAGADLVLVTLLHPQRLGRVERQRRLDSLTLSVGEIMDEMIAAMMVPTPSQSHRRRVIAEVGESVLVSRLIELADNEGASPSVRAEAEAATRRIARLLSERGGVQGVSDPHARRLGRLISIWLVRGSAPDQSDALTPSHAPPGEPIGAQTLEDWCSHGCGSH